LTAEQNRLHYAIKFIYFTKKMSVTEGICVLEKRNCKCFSVCECRIVVRE